MHNEYERDMYTNIHRSITEIIERDVELHPEPCPCPFHNSLFTSYCRMKGSRQDGAESNDDVIMADDAILGICKRARKTNALVKLRNQYALNLSSNYRRRNYR